MHRILYIRIAVLCMCVQVIGQAASDTAQTITSRTDFVEVAVLVKQGSKHVAGLRKEDFVLKQDRTEQPIATFEEIRNIPAASGAVVSSSGNNQSEHPVSMAANTAGQRPQVTIIALDVENTPTLDRAHFVNEFQKYASVAGSKNGLIGLVSIERTGIRVLHDFTGDAKKLLPVLEKKEPIVPAISTAKNYQLIQMTDSETLPPEGAAAHYLRTTMEDVVRFQDRARKIGTLLGVQQLAQALKGIPGRKSLVLRNL